MDVRRIYLRRWEGYRGPDRDGSGLSNLGKDFHRMQSWRVWLPFILIALLPASAARGETAPAPGSLADVCPSVDGRDTVQSVRSGVAERLGPPVNEETVGTQVILTYRQKDGSRLFVTLTRDNDKLEATCDTAKP